MSDVPASLVPTLDPAPLTTPATEWAVNTNDVLAYVDGSAVETPGPTVPGAFPDTILAAGIASDIETSALKGYLPAEADMQLALNNAGQAAKDYLSAQVAGYFGVQFTPPNAAASLGSPQESPTDSNDPGRRTPTPMRSSSDHSTIVQTEQPALSLVIASPPPSDEATHVTFSSISAEPTRPPLVPGSSSFHSHGFGPSGSAPSSIYASPDRDADYDRPPSTTAPSNNYPIAVLAVAPIPPAPLENMAYLPIAGELGEEMIIEERRSTSGNVHPEKGKEAQRASFSDPHYGVLGREDAPGSAQDAKSRSNPAAESEAVFTKYGVHVPPGRAAVHAASTLAEEEAGRGNTQPDDDEENEMDTGKSRRSRLVSKVKEKIHFDRVAGCGSDFDV
ncbi:hypothetical protein B0H17DRAFT_1209712 [Mycena rosella]|uniref:Uncharacterized protein n=1 Tax=Mycena rosella TaxID=1033263 RepID=A0AAD7G9P0_MYCRO|nr:hypothetical protein B0H17DRAFT_1209712 [Mycena rosella]